MADVGSANIEITAEDDQARQTVGGFMGFLKKTGSIAAGIAGGFALFETAKNTFAGLYESTIGANAGMETYRNTLATVLKSWEKADQTLAWVETFAAKTPFEIPELVEATTRLETYGITAKDTLGSIGDMASVMGKPLMQAVEAVADAQTGELERLKEFGITKQMLIDEALRLGKGEIVNAKGQITDMEALNEALFSIMRERYSGGMELQAQTFNGMISNAKDSMSMIAREMSRPVFDKLKEGLATLVPVLGGIADYITGDFAGAIEQIEGAVGHEMAANIFIAIDAVEKGFARAKQFVIDLLPTLQNLLDILGLFLPVITTVGGGAAEAVGGIMDIVPDMTEGITGMVEEFLGMEAVIPILAGVQVGMVAYQYTMQAIEWAQKAWTAAVAIHNALLRAQTAYMIASAAAGGGLRGVIAGLRAAFLALNTTMAANPIGLVVAILAGLVAAFIVAYQTSDKFRAIVDRAWKSLKAGFAATINWFTTTLPAWVASVVSWFINLKDQVVNSITGFTSSAVSKWNNFKTSVSNIVSNFVALTVLAFTTLYSKVSSWISNLVNGAVNLFNSLRARVMAIIQPFVTFFVNSWENLKLLVLSIVTGLASLLIGDFEGMRLALIGIITALKNQAVNLWNLLKSTVIAAAVALWNQAKSLFNSGKNAVISTVTSLKNSAVNLFNNLKSGAVKSVNALRTGAISAINNLKNSAVNLINNLKSGAVNAFNSLKTGAINAVRNLYSGAISLFNSLRSGASSAVNNARSNIVNAFNSAKSSAVNAVRNLYNGVVQWLRNVPGKVVEMKNRMISTIRGINLYQMGRNVIQGFINGIGAMIGAVRTKVGSVVEALKSKLTSKLKMGSPSRLLEQYGNWTFEGFINGADDMMGGIRDVAGKAADAIQPNVNQMSPDAPFFNTLRGLGNSLMNFATGNQGSLNNDRPYVLQVNLNGRTIAEETYTDIQDLQNRAEARARRARGEVI